MVSRPRFPFHVGKNSCRNASAVGCNAFDRLASHELIYQANLPWCIVRISRSHPEARGGIDHHQLLADTPQTAPPNTRQAIYRFSQCSLVSALDLHIFVKVDPQAMILAGLGALFCRASLQSHQRYRYLRGLLKSVKDC